MNSYQVTQWGISHGSSWEQRGDPESSHAIGKGKEAVPVGTGWLPKLFSITAPPRPGPLHFFTPHCTALAPRLSLPDPRITTKRTQSPIVLQRLSQLGTFQQLQQRQALHAVHRPKWSNWLPRSIQVETCSLWTRAHRTENLLPQVWL